VVAHRRPAPRPSRPTQVTMLVVRLALALTLAVSAGLVQAAQPSRSPRATPPGSPLAPPERARVVEVVDGDTLHVRPAGAGAAAGQRRPAPVRLYGVDAPEKAQPWGREAKQALSALVLAKDVELVRVTTDHFGRQVAMVTVDGRDVSAALVEGGHAWAFRRYLGRRPGDERFCRLEYAAREARVGLWSLPPAERDAPWVHRLDGRGRDRLAAERGAEDCVERYEKQ